MTSISTCGAKCRDRGSTTRSVTPPLRMWHLPVHGHPHLESAGRLAPATSGSQIPICTAQRGCRKRSPVLAWVPTYSTRCQCRFDPYDRHGEAHPRTDVEPGCARTGYRHSTVDLPAQRCRLVIGLCSSCACSRGTAVAAVAAEFTHWPRSPRELRAGPGAWPPQPALCPCRISPAAAAHMPEQHDVFADARWDSPGRGLPSLASCSCHSSQHMDRSSPGRCKKAI